MRIGTAAFLCFGWMMLASFQSCAGGESTEDIDSRRDVEDQSALGTTDESAATPTLSDEESALAALRGMLEAARQGDWETYVDVYYGEADKFRSANDRQVLIERFRQKYADRVVEQLERAVTVRPLIDGGKALFRDDDEDLAVLYKSESGKWQFHL